MSADSDRALSFCVVSVQDAAAIRQTSQVATAILRDYYDPIISKRQNDYMLGLFQTEAAVKAQIEHGYCYELVQIERDVGGFLATFPRDGGLYISKFYLAEPYRQKGYGRRILAHICEQAKKQGLGYLELNVNKHNPTIAAYEAMGFVKVRAEKNAIGGGFYMDDYVYRLSLAPNIIAN